MVALPSLKGMRRLDISISQYPQLPKLRPNPTLLEPTKLAPRIRLREVIDPNRPALNLIRHLRRLHQIRSKHRRPQPHRRVVRPRNHLADTLVRLHRNYRPERLLRHDHRVLRRVVDDCRLDEIPGTALYLRIPQREFIPLLLGVLEEGFHPFVLHLVLNGAQHDARLVAGADLEGFGDGGDGGDEGGVNRLMDVDSFGGDADLAAVEKCAHRDFGGNVVDVHVWQDDCGVVATHFLERDVRRFDRRELGAY
jgi:hypothetical protein